MSNQQNGGQIFQRFEDLQSKLGNSKRITTSSQRDSADSFNSHKRERSEIDDSDPDRKADGSATQSIAETSNGAIIESMSKFRLSERVMKAQEVKKRLMEQTFVPIQSVDDHIEKLNRPAVSSSNFLQHIEAMRTVNPKDLQDWATVGVLAANPEERTSSTSAKYSLLKITDLVDVQLNVLLFGSTHEAWAKRLKLGMVIGIQHPKILRPTEHGTVSGIHVDKVNNLFIIGWSKDCTQCEAFLLDDSQCSTIIDRRTGIYCEEHVRNAFKRSKNTRMELASGNISMAICGATDATNEQGRHVYKIKGGIPAQARNTHYRASQKDNVNAAYVLDGRRGVVTNGKSVNDLLSANNSKENKKELVNFLSARNDFGAQLLRRATGLGTEPEGSLESDKKATSAFSAEAIRKIGFNPDASAQMSCSDINQKRQAIDRLLRREKDLPTPSASQPDLSSQSKEKYVYL